MEADAGFTSLGTFVLIVEKCTPEFELQYVSEPKMSSKLGENLDQTPEPIKTSLGSTALVSY